MKTFETKKLIYDKYLYKIVFYNKLATIFTKTWNRNKWAHALKEIQRLDNLYLAGKPLLRNIYRYEETISTEEFLYAKLFLSYLQTQDFNSYIIRTENNTISVASNELSWLNVIKRNINLIEWWEPTETNKSILTNIPNIILTNKTPEYQYKVYLKHKVSVNLSHWLENNSQKCKIGKTALANIKEQYWTAGNYFYVKDHKTLMLLEISFIDNIKRIEKLISKDDVDKYNYGIEQ
jgi:hypothetical protein